jgi:hypothetical protein
METIFVALTGALTTFRYASNLMLTECLTINENIKNYNCKYDICAGKITCVCVKYANVFIFLISHYRFFSAVYKAYVYEPVDLY